MRKNNSSKDNASFKDLMRDKEKKLSETEHLLARLFRKILAERGILSSEMDQLIDRYYRKIHTNRHGDVDILKVNQDKSNLTRALAKDTLPWRRFETVIQILGPSKYFLTLKMEGADGTVYEHTVGTKNRYASLAAQILREEEEDEEDE